MQGNVLKIDDMYEMIIYPTRFPKDVVDFLKNHAVIVSDADGKKYYGLRQWFEEDDIDNGLFKVHYEPDLPEIVMEYLAPEEAPEPESTEEAIQKEFAG